MTQRDAKKAPQAFAIRPQNNSPFLQHSALWHALFSTLNLFSYSIPPFIKKIKGFLKFLKKKTECVATLRNVLANDTRTLDTLCELSLEDNIEY